MEVNDPKLEEKKEIEVTSAVIDEKMNDKKRKKKHRKKNKSGINMGEFPVCVSQNDKMGRRIVATQNIDTGGLIFAEKAVAWVTKQAEIRNFCHECSRPGVMLGCQKCDRAVYCSPECMDRASALHSMECDAWKVLTGVSEKHKEDPQLLAIVLRIVIVAACEGSKETKEVSQKSGSVAHVASTMKHVMFLEAHEHDFEPAFAQSMSGSFQDLMPHLPDPVQDFLKEKPNLPYSLACRVNTNAHGMVDNSGSNMNIGFGLFPRASMFNHSCAPNCAFVAIDGVLYVRANSFIGSGQECTIRYIDLYQTYVDRMIELKQSRHFICGCQFCQVHRSGIKLSKSAVTGPDDTIIGGFVCLSEECAKNGGVMVVPSENQIAQMNDESENVKKVTHNKQKGKGKSSGKSLDLQIAPDDVLVCSICVRPQRLSQLKESESRVFEDYGKAMNLISEKKIHESYNAFQKLFKDANGILHPKHRHLFNAYSIAMNAAHSIDDLGAATRYCRLVLGCMDEVYPKYEIEKANYLFKLGQLLEETLNQKRSKLPKNIVTRLQRETNEAYANAEEQYRVCFGSEHPMTVKAEQKLSHKMKMA